MKKITLICLLFIGSTSFAKTTHFSHLINKNAGKYIGHNIEGAFTHGCKFHIDNRKMTLSVNFDTTDSAAEYNYVEKLDQTKVSLNGPYHYNSYEIQTKTMILYFNKKNELQSINRKPKDYAPDGCYPDRQ
ncbi:MAG: hypothetical protein KA715_04655 [Xanthomonadaceae bacterium]|nr:hypothetical protein [Xanthomonadaceae bacterium]